MPPNVLPERVTRFITDHIPSVERLEILLLLFETRRAWAVNDIEEHIRSSRESVAQNVEALAAARLLAANPGAPVTYRYTATAPDLDAVVAELAGSYRARRVAVIEQIYAERKDSLRSFSNAFKLGRPHDR